MTTRPQAPKPYTPRADIARVQELRRSNATAPIPSGKAYKRKPKHKEW